MYSKTATWKVIGWDGHFITWQSHDSHMTLCLVNASIVLLTLACWNLDSISPSTHSKASSESLCSSAILREQSHERRRMLKSKVAFLWACLEISSSPSTMVSFLVRSLTPLGDGYATCNHQLIKTLAPLSQFPGMIGSRTHSRNCTAVS